MQHLATRALVVLALAGVALAGVLTATANAGPTTVHLGGAADYAVLGGSAITNTGVSTITGDVGSSPTHTMTGFGPCPAADCAAITGVSHDVADPNDAQTQQAKAALTTAYDDAFGRTGGAAVSTLGSGATLVSGVYTSAGGIAVGGDLTLDAQGDPNAVFIFQAKTGSLITAAGVASGIPNTRVLLTNGAQACNVFWQVGTSATIETATQFVGTIMANTSVTLKTGATLDGGRALARNGAVTLDTNTIRKATCATPTERGDGGSAPTEGTTPGATTPTTTPLTPVSKPTAKPAVAAAHLRAPGGTVRGPFRVTVTGRGIAKVIYLIDGRRVAVVRAKRGRKKFVLRIDPRRHSHRVHRVTARVTYTPASGRTTTTHRTTFRRQAPPRSPRFTG